MFIIYLDKYDNFTIIEENSDDNNNDKNTECNEFLQNS